jgi:hypothetical protein
VSDGFVCDGCGATLLLDSDVRYVVDVRGYAAYDPMEITADDLERDFRADMNKLIDELSQQDAKSAEEDVHKEMRLDLCPICWKRFVRDPLAGLRQGPERGSRGEGDGDSRPDAEDGEEKKSQGN